MRAKPPALHTVTQAFCSALPVACGEPPAALWEPLARLVHLVHLVRLVRLVSYNVRVSPRVMGLVREFG